MPGITLTEDKKKLIISPNCSIVEIFVFAEVAKHLMIKYSLNYLDENPDLVIQEYYKRMFDIANMYGKDSDKLTSYL